MAHSPSPANGNNTDGTPAPADVPTQPSASANAPPPATAFSLRRNIQQLPPLTAIFCVALGGALGALLRYGFIQACAPYQSSSTTSTAADGSIVVTLHKPFPLSTFVSNMLGCTLIGLLSILLPALLPSPPALLHCRSLLVTGLLGALTTMSSFALDTAQLLQHQRSRRQGEPGVVVHQPANSRVWVGVVYWLVTNVGGVGLVVVGRAVGRWVERRYVRVEERKAEVGRAGEHEEEEASNAARAVVREIVAEHKEGVMVEEGGSLDAESTAQ